MSLQDWLKSRWLIKHQTSRQEILDLLSMADRDLAGLYGTTTKRLNEQVKRNRGRFPEDFMFQLTKKEKAEVVAICDHLAKLKFSPVLPNAFTEHGAVMVAKQS